MQKRAGQFSSKYLIHYEKCILLSRLEVVGENKSQKNMT